MANGKVVIIVNNEEIVMSEKYACVKCNYSIPELEPRLFSFNSPYGACEECKGIGTKLKISEDLIMPDKEKTLNQLFDEFYFNIKGKEIDEVRKNEVINILEEIEGKVQ